MGKCMVKDDGSDGCEFCVCLSEIYIWHFYIIRAF